MKRDIRVYLDDILESVDKIQDYTANISEEHFKENGQLHDAVLRRFAIIELKEKIKTLKTSIA